MLADTAEPLPVGFKMGELESASQIIAWDNRNEHFLLEDADYKGCVLTLDTPPDAEYFHDIISKVGKAAKSVSKAAA